MTKKKQDERSVSAGGLPSRASATRFSLYLRVLEGWLRDGMSRASSRRIAETLGIQDAQVRKDLAYLGSLGQPGVGYNIADLIAAIRQVLGLNRKWISVLIGVGNLARALLRYRGFQEQGFHIAALFDSDPSKVGEKIEGLAVRAIDNLPKQIKDLHAELAIITVPSEAAQAVADQLASSGIRGILNFAPIVLRLPPKMALVNVDLAIQLEQLAFQVQMGNPVE